MNHADIPREISVKLTLQNITCVADITQGTATLQVTLAEISADAVLIASRTMNRPR